MSAEILESKHFEKGRILCNDSNSRSTGKNKSAGVHCPSFLALLPQRKTHIQRLQNWLHFTANCDSFYLSFGRWWRSEYTTWHSTGCGCTMYMDLLWVAGRMATRGITPQHVSMTWKWHGLRYRLSSDLLRLYVCIVCCIYKKVWEFWPLCHYFSAKC